MEKTTAAARARGSDYLGVVIAAVRVHRRRCPQSATMCCGERSKGRRGAGDGEQAHGGGSRVEHPMSRIVLASMRAVLRAGLSPG